MATISVPLIADLALSFQDKGKGKGLETTSNGTFVFPGASRCLGHSHDEVITVAGTRWALPFLHPLDDYCVHIAADDLHVPPPASCGAPLAP
jgi:hypothetical protein